MEYTIKGDELTIKVKLNPDAPKSSSGKSYNLATTGGFQQTGIQYKGKPVSVSLNVNSIIPKSERGE